MKNGGPPHLVVFDGLSVRLFFSVAIAITTYWVYNSLKIELLGGYEMEQVIVRVSSKRQITLPAAIYKKLGIQPGQKLLLEVQGDKIILSPKTTSYTELLAGSLKNIYGRTPEEVNAYIRKERETWDRTLS